MAAFGKSQTGLARSKSHRSNLPSPDTPLMAAMSSEPIPGEAGVTNLATIEPPTVASFSPNQLTTYSNKQRATILVHQKSPLLVATPPQITRVLAYSHPFLLPLNKLAGLISWTTGDAWESFLLVSCVVAATLYGDAVLRFAGPLVLVVVLVVGMWLRRYSPLSSTGWISEQGGKGHMRKESEGKNKHHKSLDEIVDTLQTLTTRCNILLDPFLRMTEFLSTQQTATGATVAPSLTRLFVRLSVLTPLWYILTLPPFYIITTRRVFLTVELLILTWHCHPARVARAILWRSRLVRRICCTATGLDLGEYKLDVISANAHAGAKSFAASMSQAQLDKARNGSSIRFTFVLYENQRRWIGIGWTSSLLPYERAAWTDEHDNPTLAPESFKLPKVDGGHAKWRWVEGGSWTVEGAGQSSVAEAKGDGSAAIAKKKKNDAGWIYYDNHWKDGRRGEDGWGRYTRRRKWVRDAELVEVNPSPQPPKRAAPAPPPIAVTPIDDAASTTSPSSKKNWFRKRTDSTRLAKSRTASSTTLVTPTVPTLPNGVTTGADVSRTVSKAPSVNGSIGRPSAEGGINGVVGDREKNKQEDNFVPPAGARDNEWGVADEMRMELG